MEHEATIVMMIGMGFLGIIGYKAYTKYVGIETNRTIVDLKSSNDNKLLEWSDVIRKLKKSNENYEFKIKRLRNHYEFDYDDVMLEDEEDEGTILSDIAKSIYPKLPPSLAHLLDKEEFQNAIVKTVEKKPDILNMFIDKWLNKTADQGSDSNTTPKLKETYL